MVQDLSDNFIGQDWKEPHLLEMGNRKIIEQRGIYEIGNQGMEREHQKVGNSPFEGRLFSNYFRLFATRLISKCSPFTSIRQLRLGIPKSLPS
jgi:hypothetical protein